MFETTANVFFVTACGIVIKYIYSFVVEYSRSRPMPEVSFSKTVSSADLK